MNLKQIKTPIRDSKEIEQFAFNLAVRKKAKCPVTGDWELKGSDVYNNGEKVGTIPSDLAGALNKILELVKNAQKAN